MMGIRMSLPETFISCLSVQQLKNNTGCHRNATCECSHENKVGTCRRSNNYVYVMMCICIHSHFHPPDPCIFAGQSCYENYYVSNRLFSSLSICDWALLWCMSTPQLLYMYMYRLIYAVCIVIISLRHWFHSSIVPVATASVSCHYNHQWCHHL